MEIQTGENTLLLLMINSYLSFLSFTTKFFEIFKKILPLYLEKKWFAREIKTCYFPCTRDALPLGEG